MVNDIKKSDTWKTQLTIAINFMSFTETDEEDLMYSKIYNIKILINDKPDQVIEEPDDFKISN